jgi:flagellar protein FliS
VSYAAAGYGTAAKYQEMEVLGASPAQLVVIVYDHLLVTLRRARIAVEQGNVELRCAQLSKAREALSELLVTLDLERGGDVAKQLSGLYTFFIAELMDIGHKPSVQRLDRISTMVAELRDAFAQVAATVARPTASAA